MVGDWEVQSEQEKPAWGDERLRDARVGQRNQAIMRAKILVIGFALLVLFLYVRAVRAKGTPDSGKLGRVRGRLWPVLVNELKKYVVFMFGDCISSSPPVHSSTHSCDIPVGGSGAARSLEICWASGSGGGVGIGGSGRGSVPSGSGVAAGLAGFAGAMVGSGSGVICGRGGGVGRS
jgi:hypothetical protein